MFGFFKKFREKPEPESPSRSAPDSSPAPLQKQPRQESATPPPAAARPVPEIGGEVILLPLKAVLKRSPGELLSRLQSSPQPDTSLSISRNVIAEQLRNGVVKITLGELRNGTPEGLFKNNPAEDHHLIELPLSEVLTRIPPELIQRRADQKKVVVPPEIPTLFGPKGEAASVRIGSSKSIVPAAPPRESQAAQVEEKAKDPIAPEPLKVSPAPASIPISSAPAPAPPPPVADRPSPQEAAPSAPISMSPQLRDAMTAAVTSVKSSLPAEAPASSGKKATFALSALATNWPIPVIQEMEKLAISASPVQIPEQELTSGLQSGRVQFTWGQILSWIPRPSGTPLQTQHTDTLLDLPLKILVPAFLAQFKPARPVARLPVPDGIPDLFRKADGGAQASVPKPEERTIPAPSMAAPASPQTSRLGQLLGAPDKTAWTPAEITQRVAQMPGMSGAVLATTDGLLVSAQLAEGVKGEAVAAFLPQIYSKLEVYLKELQVGGLNQISFGTEKGSWILLKAGSHYLIGLGRPGQPLPSAQLSQVAAELSKT